VNCSDISDDRDDHHSDPTCLADFFPAWVISTIYGPQFSGAALPLAIISVGKLVFS
jgi:hypothetical protein